MTSSFSMPPASVFNVVARLRLSRSSTIRTGHITGSTGFTSKKAVTKMKNHDQGGFILPLTMILSLLLLAFVMHAIFLLNSDRGFYQSVVADFQLQQIRKCAIADIGRAVQKKLLPEHGSFVYDRGTASYKTAEAGDRLDVTITIAAGQSRETDKITYRLTDSRAIDWIERIDP
ncbi:hypothetical protein EWH99_11245 [Sporolactobacillus sp. THM7-7]|nr:hypothetical protein EWH99_11245 [Sporolactobacillus sp. THM7-7]